SLRLPHEAIDLREAEAMAGFALGGEEWLEQVLAHFLAHARTVVLDRDADGASHAVLLRRRRLRAHVVAGPDHDGALRLHRVARVRNEVDERDLQWSLVRAATPQVGAQGEGNTDAGARCMAQQAGSAC